MPACVCLLNVRYVNTRNESHVIKVRLPFCRQMTYAHFHLIYSEKVKEKYSKLKQGETRQRADRFFFSPQSESVIVLVQFYQEMWLVVNSNLITVITVSTGLISREKPVETTIRGHYLCSLRDKPIIIHTQDQGHLNTQTPSPPPPLKREI